MSLTPTTVPHPDSKTRVKRPSAKEKQEKLKLITSLLKKHNAIIHIEGNLTLLERRLYNVLLLNAYDQLENERTHSIPVWILCEMLGFNSHNVSHLQSSLKTLQTTILEVNLLKDGRRIWEAMTMLSYAKIENGICTYRYDEAIAKRLHTPEVYTSINLAVQNEFSSAHALSLYENCVRFRDVGKTGVWELDLLRLMMGVHNEKSYKEFKTFNVACLKKSIKEINERSDILIEPVFEKSGRSVAGVAFKVMKKQQRSLYAGDIDDPTTKVKQSSVFIKLRSLGMVEQMALMYVVNSADRVDLALTHLDKEEERAPGRIRNKVAYLRALIDSGVDFDSTPEEVDGAAKGLIEETRRQKEEAERENVRLALISKRKKAAIEQLSAEDCERFATEYKRISGRTFEIRPDGRPSSQADRTTFSIWLRSQITVDEPTQDEIAAELKADSIASVAGVPPGRAA